MNQQSGQRKYTITYIIVAAVLVALALVALYGVRQATTSQTEPPISSESLAEHQDGSKPHTEASPATPKQNTQQEKKDKQEDKKQAAPSGQPAPDHQASSTQPTTPRQSRPQESRTATGSSESSATSLPTTGPAEDGIIPGIALAVLTSVALAYRRSSLLV
ncbi:MAG: hypothetical protein Q4F02_01520 [Candidatus Saccharibacteria bacterium]|nr:hypothetical protein [Candidatus Saccharibacteria bacterium]